MFVALRDLAFARGRFTLIASVVALITLLVGFLTGLTGGLAGQNVDSVLSWKADRLVLSAPADGAEPEMATSSLTQKEIDAYSHAAGDIDITPVGVSQTSAEHGDHTTGVAIMAGAPGAGTGPGQADGVAAPAVGQVVLSEDAADALGASTGDEVSVAGQDLRVAAVTGTGHYSHVPVVSVAKTTWQELAARTGSPSGTVATALIVTGSPSKDAVASADTAAHTTSLSGLSQLTAIGSFRSEIGSLGLMIGLLLAISALVIGAFFTVWTLQRKADIAVLKALGTPVSALRRDALGQAGVVLVIGIAIGLGIVTAVGSLLTGTLPFILSPLTTLGPGVLMALLGLVGAAAALRSVTRTDPLTALGSNR